MYCKNKAEIHQQKSKKVPMIQHDISWDIVEIWTALPQLGVFGKRGYLTEHREVQSERIWVELHKNTWLSNNFSNLRRISVNNSEIAMLIKIVSKVCKVWHWILWFSTILYLSFLYILSILWSWWNVRMCKILLSIVSQSRGQAGVFAQRGNMGSDHENVSSLSILNWSSISNCYPQQFWSILRSHWPNSWFKKF